MEKEKVVKEEAGGVDGGNGRRESDGVSVSGAGFDGGRGGRGGSRGGGRKGREAVLMQTHFLPCGR